MPQVITIGSALVDIFIHTHKFHVQETAQGVMLCQTYGSKTEVDNFQVLTGGGGGNTAVGFSRLGFESAVICETGKDSFAYVVSQDLKENKVATNLMITEKLEQTGGAVIMVCAQGERSVLVHRGAAARLDPFDIPPYWLSQAQQVHLCSLGGQQATLEKIFKTVAQSDQTSLSWNPGEKELLFLAERQLAIEQIPCEIFLVNEEEWSMVSAVQGEILRNFPYVVVTAGTKGGTVYVKNQDSFHFSALDNQAIDATGAGDAFAVGFVAGMMWGKTPQESAQLGAKNSASVVNYFGAKPGLLKKQELL